MRKSAAAALSGGFFVVAPGTVVGLIPWLITRWRVRRPVPGGVATQAVGVVLVTAGLVPAGSAFVEFVRAGGTPIPLAPTDRLVVSGFNRHVRNPMYVGLLLAVLGQALILGNLGLLLYAAAVWVAPAAFVHWYEEPTLARRFGADYEAYRAAVPGWWPRARPWTPTERVDGTRPAPAPGKLFFWLLENTLNRATRRLVRSGKGPFALVRHTGRRSGRRYETPLVLARTPDGFVAELTYGPKVDWYRNIVAAGGCVVVHGGREHVVDRIEACDTADGLRAFGFPRSLILRLLRRHEFRLLHTLD